MKDFAKQAESGLKCLAGGHRTTSRHSDISASREAAAKLSKSSLMFYSVQSSRTEQSPKLFGRSYTQLYGAKEVQWKDQVWLDV